MPKCSNCNNVQAKLNKRKLCKKCHNNYNDQNKGIDLKEDQLDESINMQLPNDRSIIDLIKENMEQEKKWNVEVISMLRDQIDYLKNDIIHKNTLIEQLICNENKSNNTIPSLPSADADNNILECSNISTPCANSVSTNGTNISTSNNNSYTSDDVKIQNTPDDINWKEVRNKKLSDFQDPPPPLSTYVRKSSTPLTLDVQFQTTPPPPPPLQIIMNRLK